MDAAVPAFATSPTWDSLRARTAGPATCGARGAAPPGKGCGSSHPASRCQPPAPSAASPALRSSPSAAPKAASYPLATVTWSRIAWPPDPPRSTSRRNAAISAASAPDSPSASARAMRAWASAASAAVRAASAWAKASSAPSTRARARSCACWASVTACWAVAPVSAARATVSRASALARSDRSSMARRSATRRSAD